MRVAAQRRLDLLRELQRRVRPDVRGDRDLGVPGRLLRAGGRSGLLLEGFRLVAAGQGTDLRCEVTEEAESEPLDRKLGHGRARCSPAAAALRRGPPGRAAGSRPGCRPPAAGRPGPRGCAAGPACPPRPRRRAADARASRPPAGRRCLTRAGNVPTRGGKGADSRRQTCRLRGAPCASARRPAVTARADGPRRLLEVADRHRRTRRPARDHPARSRARHSLPDHPLRHPPTPTASAASGSRAPPPCLALPALGLPPPAAHRGDHRARRPHRPARGRAQPRPARRDRGRPRRRRPTAGHRRGQPPTAAQRGGVRDALRGRPTARLVRAHPTTPTQPRRGPPRQHRALPDRALPAALRPPHPRLRRPTHRPGLSKPEIIRCLKR